MIVIEFDDRALTEQEKGSIRGLVEKGCDPHLVIWMFKLKDGELASICA